MTMIQGVSIAVFANDGAKIEAQPDGYLGALMGRRVILEVQVAHDRPNVFAFTLDGQYRVLPKKDEGSDGKIYRLSIPLRNHPEEGFGYTHARMNNLRLVEAGDGGNARLWEISVISQKGEFFLVAQRDQEAECFRDGDAIVCPSFPGRPQIAAYLASLYATRIGTLPFLPPASPDPPAETFGPKRGRALWWSASQGMGRILTDNGVAGVHWRNVAPTGRRAYLAPGDLVTYEKLRVPHASDRAKSYALEAVGVKRITRLGA